MNTSELLHTIAKDRIEGMRTIDSYQLKATIINVTKPNMTLDLKNDMWILNTKKLPEHISTLEILSSDNVFNVTPFDYEMMDEYRYQVFTDYMDIETVSDDFQPYRLEFVMIIPHRI